MILVCGEALMDLTAEPTVDGAARYRAAPGGSPLNTAVALGRLGTPVALLARLSTDRFGGLLRAHLAASDVQLGYAVPADEPTTLALVDVSGGTPAYSFYVQGTADWQWRNDELPGTLPAEVAAIHAGSLALALEPGGTVLASLLERERGRRTISLDPNVRPRLVGSRETYRRRLESWVRLADLVKVSAEDLAWVYPDEGAAAVACRWQAAGTAVVVLTDGAAGATAYSGGTGVHVPAEPVLVADTVGAGDSYAGALLDWLARHDRLRMDRLAGIGHDELASALAFAGRVAAITCSRPGADPPFRAELGR
ncbi:MAG: carbohydrate kinase [Actinomycetota bacterium]|nr:carbohydrate kinase [Actinomycetota bacterium]